MKADWIPTTERLPEVCKPVIGYADRWIDSEYNEMGMRECFRNDDYWLSAAWNNYQDTWDAAMGAPEYWTHFPDAPICRTCSTWFRKNCTDLRYADGLIDATNDCRVDLVTTVASPALPVSDNQTLGE